MTTSVPHNVCEIIADTIKAEGGDKVTHDPADRGGLTKFGITQATWQVFRKPNWPFSVADSTYRQAEELYKQRYWIAPKFDKISALSIELAVELFDWGVTSGPSRPVKALQRCLNVLNRQSADFPDIEADGVYGRMSHVALSTFAKMRGAEGERYLLEMVRALRRVFYIEIAERDATQERFENGWQSRIK